MKFNFSTTCWSNSARSIARISLWSFRSIGLVLSLTIGFNKHSGSSVVQGRPCAIGILSFSSSAIIFCSFLINSSSFTFPLCSVLSLNGFCLVTFCFSFLFHLLPPVVPHDSKLFLRLLLYPVDTLALLLSHEEETEIP
ncbi:hypothetical protein V8G54_013346 [Vigna mungo]|uniref:Uncharacterized protein n=1 Tax=Vigna mungo TaxID=3915 RepID=A0AAQ3NT59_VIGMU